MKNLFLSLMIACALCSVAVQAQPTSARLITPSGLTASGGIETFRVGTSQGLTWDVTLSPEGSRYIFQFGTSPTGPWTNLALPDVPVVVAGKVTTYKNTYVLDAATRPAGQVGGRGAYPFGFRVPNSPTTTGYVRMVLVRTDGTLDTTVTSRNTNPFTVLPVAPAVTVDSTLAGNITSTITLSKDKVYGLRGFVWVQDGGVLRIEAGTVVVGDQPGINSALTINRGGKIFAQGTPTSPIVFTSAAPPGQRARGDWGGLLLMGRARINNPGGESIMEGFPDDPINARFGGTDDNDSSGVLSYVRCEFGGIAFFPNQEINGLTLGGVGRRTVVNNVQVSYAGDDSFEWFGGSVDSRNLIAYNGIDDDFDTDNGFSGRNQFLLGRRFRQIADQSTSQALESDNDANGTGNTPLTTAIYSNITAIGPVADTSWTTGSGANQYNSLFGAAMNIRRNSRISVFNSVFIGWPNAVDISGPGEGLTADAASNDLLQLRGNSFVGIKGNLFRRSSTGTTNFNGPTWLQSAANGNTILTAPGSVAVLAKVGNPFVEDNNDFNAVPATSSVAVTSGATFTKRGTVAIDDPWFQQVNYDGAFAPDVARRWDLPWSQYDPVNAIYTKGGNTSGPATRQTVIVNVKQDPLPSLKALDVVTFPNPANTAVTVRYNLPVASIVSAQLVDMMGNVVLSVLQNASQQEGIYDFRIITENLTPGVYMVKIATPNGMTTQKISIVR
jgi:Secretion system C-terminal sorting domain